MSAGFPVPPGPAQAAPHRRAAPAGRAGQRAARPTWCCRCSSRRASASRSPVGSMPGVVQHTRDSLRKAAAEAVDAGVGGLILFGIPAVKDARGSAADDPAGHRPAGAGRPGRRGRRRHRADGRPVPGRVHRPRPLRPADPVRRGRQRRDAGAVRVDRGGPGRGGRARGRAERHDGRPGRRDQGRAGRGRLRRRRDLRLLGEVRLGLLRAVPRGGRVRAAVRRPGFLPAGPGQRRRGAARGPARRRRGRRHRHGEARARLPRHHQPGGRDRAACRSPPTRSAASTRWSRRRRRTAGWTGTG